MKKKILLILALLWFIISFLIIRITYAKYLSSIDSNANIGISAWKIKLNTQDVLQNNDFSQNLELNFPGNEYYSEDTIVPGALGYFDLAIDTSEVNLAVRFKITATNATNSDVSELKIIGYSYPGQQNNITYLENGANEVQSSAASSVNSSTIRVYVSWNDDSNTENLNDVQDTQIALNNGKAIVSVNVLFEQLVN